MGANVSKDQKMSNPSLELLSSLNFCVIDLETTGGNPEVDRIIEIGMVKIDNLKLTEEQNYLVNPEKEIPEFIQKLTGIKGADVAHSPKIEEIIDEIVQFIGDSILVAHNTSFDIPFLNGTLKKLGRPTLENKVICTNIMTKYLIPDIMSSNLTYMSQIFNIEHSHAHRASEDAKATGRLLLKYMEIFEKKNIRKINQLYYPRNRFELDRIHIEKNEGLSKVEETLKKIERPIVLTVKGDNGVILTILPIKNPSLEHKQLREFLDEYRWDQISIKLCGPFIEGLFFLTQNFIKIPEFYRQKTVDYFISQYGPFNSNDSIFNKHDFLVTPHLISGQLIVFSFLNFSPYSQLVFKYPSHRKKLHQFLLGQIGRFETQQKGKRKIFIQNSIKDVIEHLFAQELKLRPDLCLSISLNEIKEDSKGYLSRIEKWAEANANLYNFPTNHL